MQSASGIKGGFLSQEIEEGRSDGKKTNDRKYGNTTITPLTNHILRQLIANSNEESLYVDNTKLEFISLCGRIISIEHDSNRIYVTVNDCSGEIKATIYCKSKTEMPLYYQNAQLRENVYVRIIATVTPFQKGKLILCQHLVEIKNYNEVTNHLLSVIQAHLHRTKGFLNKPEEIMKSTAQKSFQKQDVSGKKPDTNRINDIVRSSKQINEKVLDVMQILAEKNEKPITPEEILKAFNNSLDDRSLKSVLSDMQNDGFIFSSGPGYKIL